MNQKWELFVDGASRGNPGASGAGIYLKNDQESVVRRGYFLGKKTNNEAEYLAMLIGMFIVKKYSKSTVIHAYSDSQLIIKQLNGQYKIKKPELYKLYTLVKDVTKELSCTFTHVVREQNQEADRLANKGVDEKILLPLSFISLLRDHEIYI